MAASWSYDGETEIVQAAALAALASVTTSLRGLLVAPGAAQLSLAADLASLDAVAPDDAAGYAAALATLYADYVAAVVAAAAAAPSPAPAAGYQASSRLPPLAADPSWGLAAMAQIGGALVPPAATGQIATNWQALMGLVEGNATTSLATLYAQTAFAGTADAEAARSALAGLIIVQTEVAAGNDSLVAAWRGLFTAAITDLTVRASGLPDVASLVNAAPLPALWLAQLLYQDGTEAAALVQRNAAPHPLFMPLAVEYLSP
jgi:hypothetical protein